MENGNNTVEVAKFGLKDVSQREKTFRNKAKSLLKDAKVNIKLAKIKEKIAENKAQKLNDLADKLISLNQEAYNKSKELTDQGKSRIDGKKAKALINRNLQDICGLVNANTLLYCTNEKVELREMWWADTWVVDMFKGLSEKTSAQEMTKFYDTIAKRKYTIEQIQSEAGLIVLKNM